MDLGVHRHSNHNTIKFWCFSKCFWEKNKTKKFFFKSYDFISLQWPRIALLPPVLGKTGAWGPVSGLRRPVPWVRPWVDTWGPSLPDPRRRCPGAGAAPDHTPWPEVSWTGLSCTCQGEMGRSFSRSSSSHTQCDKLPVRETSVS